MGLFLELIRVFGGEIMDCGVLGTLLFYLGVTLQIGFKTLGHVFALGNDANTCGKIFFYLRHEQGIMCTAEDKGINLRIEVHNLIDALLDKIVGSRGSQPHCIPQEVPRKDRRLQIPGCRGGAFGSQGYSSHS